MKTFIRISATGLALLASTWAEETPAPTPAAAPVAGAAVSWSLVYLPELDWTEAEVKQTLAMLQQLKPGVVVSLAPCPFAEAIRNLDCKPVVLDQTQRAKAGVACGLPANPWSDLEDTSTLHSLGHGDSATGGLVWLSCDRAKKRFTGPGEQLPSFAGMQVRKQLAELRGEVVFLVDPTLPTPPDEQWNLPRKNVKYSQASSDVTGFTCIRPGSLQTEVAAIDGIAPRVPVLHWIHSGANGMEWDALPADGGPSIHHSAATGATRPDDPFPNTVARLEAPPAPPQVPLWMDDYINNNPALATGDTFKGRNMDRRYGWRDSGITRSNFQILRSGDAPLPEGKPKAWDLPRCMIRSPRNLFALELYDPDEDGLDPSNGGDDGFNVYLQDLRQDKNVMLYFAGLSSAWPTAATWFTDRYVITSGDAGSSDPVVSASFTDGLNPTGDTYLTPQLHTQTLHLFDLQAGKSFMTHSIAPRVGSDMPTDRIAFPVSSSGISVWSWRTLWKAIEDGYHAKPEPAPFTAEEVAELSKLPKESGLQWKDLGIWPPPETWQLTSEKEEPYTAVHREKPVAGGDPYLTYKETADGQRDYTIAITDYPDQTRFVAGETISQVVAHADLITIGKGSLPQLGTIQRLGDDKRYLALAGTYQKPGGADSEKGNWMLLMDLFRHRAWSAHW
jgi:hypothetical protein